MSSGFTIDNLPYGVISTGDNPTPRCATALDDSAIDLAILEKDGLFKDVPGFEKEVFSQPTLNTFASLPKPSQRDVRRILQKALSDSTTKNKYAIPLSNVKNHYPMATKNFTDFYCSLEHTENCGIIMSSPPPKNWFVIPSAYNGRTSSLRVSGTPVRRPNGVFAVPATPSTHMTPAHAYQPSKRFDFELEVGIFVSKDLEPGEILSMESAREYIFGFVILNDWSARDIQGFEMVPLGPFHGKGAGTTVSGWIVTAEALGGSMVERPEGKVQSPEALPHLSWRGGRGEQTWDVELTAKVVRNGTSHLVTETNLKELYWTPYQQLVHLASAGEGLSTGDIFGTGTVTSNRIKDDGENAGIACLLERTLPQNKMASLSNSGIVWLEDGDEVIMEGWAVNKSTGRKIGFGECRGVVEPALSVS
ncbi:hypothetical protein BDV19DRAFT_399005 [Aspergillus venezuelensis]